MIVDFARQGAIPYPGVGLNWVGLATTRFPLTCVAFGRGIFIALTSGVWADQVLRSINGWDWTLHNSAAVLQWRGIAYGSGRFVAVAQTGAGNQVMVSDDGGLTWQSKAEALNLAWQGVCYCGDDTFFAVANNGAGNQFMRSVDRGNTWAQVVTPSVRQWAACASDGRGNVVAVAVDGNATNQVAQSSNYAASFVSRAIFAARQWYAIAFGNNRFVASGNDTGTADTLMYSTDLGVSWTAGFMAASVYISGLAHGAGIFGAVQGSSGTALLSYVTYDGAALSRNRGDVAFTTSWSGIAYGANKFVAVGSSVCGLAVSQGVLY